MLRGLVKGTKDGESLYFQQSSKRLSSELELDDLLVCPKDGCVDSSSKYSTGKVIK